MAQGKNKPDLSDLKARLGLKKQGAAKNEQEQESAQPQAGPSSQGQPSQAPADGPGPSAGPAKQANPAKGGPGRRAPAQSGPPGAGGPPPGAQGPPPGAGGPPPGARRSSDGASSPQARQQQPAQQQQAQRPSNQGGQAQTSAGDASRGGQASAGSSADIALDDEDLKAAGGSAFSPATVILMVVLVIVGVVFGWMASSSMQNREVYNARSEDAARVHQALQTNVENLDEAKTLVAQLGENPGESDFELNQQLADLEIAPAGNLLGGGRLLLGPEIIDSVTTYMTDARMLEEMLDEHQEATNNDKAEIQKLVEENEVVEVEDDQLAVLFDYDHLATKSGSEDYMPRKGKLVMVPSLDRDEEGKIEVQLIGTERTVKTPIQGLLPLNKGDILKSGGENALNRYQARVDRINRQLRKFEEYRGGMMSKLEALAEKDSAPLLNF